MSLFERARRGLQLFGLWTSLLIVLTPLRHAYARARCAQPRRRGPALWWAAWRAVTARPRAASPLSAFTLPGALRSYEVSGRCVTMQCERATLHIVVLADDVLRLHVQRPGEPLDAFSYAVARCDEQWPAAPFSVRLEPAALVIETAAVVCRVSRDDSRIAVHDRHSGREVMRSAWGPGWHGDDVACSFQLADEERVYGLGEKAFGMNRRGRVYQMWNDDPSGAYAPGKDPLYLGIPFYLGVRGPHACGVFFDNAHRGAVDAGCSVTDRLTMRACGGPMRWYLLAGPTATDVLRRFTELTGRMRLPPLWVLGYHQSRWSYTPAQRVLQVAAEFRRRRVPCDAIHLDIDYMDGYRCFTWHPQRFPDPPGLVGALHEQGFKLVTIIDPGIKTDRSYKAFGDGLDNGVYCTLADGSLYRGPVWPGDCCFPDFSRASSRAWWGKQCQALTDVGVDGLWNDMNEPTVFGPTSSTLPDCVRHDGDGHPTTHGAVHNVYGLLMARASAEGLEAHRPDRRTFVVTRSGWAGLQRYAMNWMGDNTSTWEHLRLTVPMIANLGLSGLAFTGPDTGGFAGDCEPELLTRWLQLGVFTPFLRNHSAMGTADQEPWAHGEPYESINRQSIELRYHLLPYIYTAFRQCSASGMPMLRPLFLMWPHDLQAAAVDDQFMFGDALLVAPVLEPGARQRDVYLPSGAWYDWWSGRRLAGGRTVGVDAPLDRLPIFARAGAIVPAWPVMQHTGERSIDVLTLYVWVGDGESVLYEDDGASTAYRQGAMRITHLRQQTTDDGLAVERQCEGPYTPSYDAVELRVCGLEAGAGYRLEVDGRTTSAAITTDAAGSARVTTPAAAR